MDKKAGWLAKVCFAGATAILAGAILISILGLFEVADPGIVYRNYIPISALVITLYFLYLALEFEAGAGTKDISETVVVVTLISAARIPFAPLPNIQPCTVMIMAVGYVYGWRKGALVGTMVPLISNFVLGHGPWTLWQMGAWALCGALGGAIGGKDRGWTKGKTWKFTAAAFLAAFAYGLIVDVSSALFYRDYYIAWITSLPFDVLHAAGNLIFAPLLAPFFIRQFRRMKERAKVRWLD